MALTCDMHRNLTFAFVNMKTENNFNRHRSGLVNCKRDLCWDFLAYSCPKNSRRIVNPSSPAYSIQRCAGAAKDLNQSFFLASTAGSKKRAFMAQ
jgi:hypothetical protein